MTQRFLQLLVLAAANPSSSAASSTSPTGKILAISLGVVCAIIAIGLWGVSRSRWGHNKPLTNCIVLAVLAHVWLLMYAYGTRVVSFGKPGNSGGTPSLLVSNIEWLDVPTEPFAVMPETTSAESLVVTPPSLLPVETQVETPVETPVESIVETTYESTVESKAAEVNNSFIQELETDSSQVVPELLAVRSDTPNQQPNDSNESTPSGKPDLKTLDMASGDPITAQDVSSDVVLSIGEQLPRHAPPEAIDARAGLNLDEKVDSAVDSKLAIATTDHTKPVTAARRPTSTTRSLDHQPIPEPYQLRFAESRLAVATQHGGDESTEASVEAGLRWLADNQETDGSWNAARHGAGLETKTMERDRAGTGAKADTAMTALSLLAFLAAGYTHAEGPYQSNVATGLGFLLQSQMPSGDLAGLKQIGNTSDVYFARMYSHGMATLAIAEAYAMTGDRRFVEPIQKALAYTLQAQNRRTGGWRYQAFSVDDPGDTSQFGWQAMALLSSQNGGFTLPLEIIPQMQGFLSRVSVGRYGGLAVYRPIPGQQPTRAMTAEALAMRLMLKQPTTAEAIAEAKQFMLQELPGTSQDNLYYWYYASMALFHLQDEAWPIWNQAMKSQLLKSQVVSGDLAGSWNPSCIWAGYGGRVYSTSMSCLCLEVYYRYLPIYRTQSFASSSQSDLKR